jgi:hypothetical protein
MPCKYCGDPIPEGVVILHDPISGPVNSPIRYCDEDCHSLAIRHEEGKLPMGYPPSHTQVGHDIRYHGSIRDW